MAARWRLTYLTLGWMLDGGASAEFIWISAISYFSWGCEQI